MVRTPTISDAELIAWAQGQAPIVEKLVATYAGHFGMKIELATITDDGLPQIYFVDRQVALQAARGTRPRIGATQEVAFWKLIEIKGYNAPPYLEPVVEEIEVGSFQSTPEAVREAFRAVLVNETQELYEKIQLNDWAEDVLNDPNL